MATLVIGLVLFFAVHSLPMKQAFRASLVTRFGVWGYKAGFSIVALFAFWLIVIGKADAPFIAIWNPPHFMAHATKLLMLPAMIFLAAAYLPGYIRQKLKNPMLIAIKTWALAHLLANGDAASMLLFSSFLIYGVVDMISVKRRSPRELAAKGWWVDVITVLLGFALYMGVAMHHAQLFGVSVF